jgi:hypothetical protein
MYGVFARRPSGWVVGWLLLRGLQGAATRRRRRGSSGSSSDGYHQQQQQPLRVPKGKKGRAGKSFDWMRGWAAQGAPE